MSAPASTTSLAWMSGMTGSLLVGDHGPEHGLLHQLAGDLGLAAKPPHRLAPGDLGQVIFEHVAGHDRSAEFRLVDGEEVHGAGAAVLAHKQAADRPSGLRH